MVGNLANVLTTTGRHEEAIARLDQAIARESEAFILYHYLAQAYEGLDRFDGRFRRSTERSACPVAGCGRCSSRGGF